MFTSDQIKAAHSKVKSGADFPAYIQDMKALGVKAYAHYVADGHIEYRGADDFNISAPAKYPTVQINAESSKEKLQHALSIHQLGETDYPTFCRDAANAGTEKWNIDIDAMTCIYYDRGGVVLLREDIPERSE